MQERGRRPVEVRGRDWSTQSSAAVALQTRYTTMGIAWVLEGLFVEAWTCATHARLCLASLWAMQFEGEATSGRHIQLPTRR